jgi:hypothetical protein
MTVMIGLDTSWFSVPSFVRLPTYVQLRTRNAVARIGTPPGSGHYSSSIISACKAAGMWQSRIYRVDPWSIWVWQYMHACMHAWALFIDPSSIHGSWELTSWARPWHESLKPQQDGRREVLFVAYSLSLVTLCIGSGSVSPACCWSGWRQRGRPSGLLRTRAACRCMHASPGNYAPGSIDVGSRLPQRKRRRRRRQSTGGGADASMRYWMPGPIGRAALFLAPSLLVFSGFLSPTTHLHLLAAHAHTRSSAAAWPVAIDTFAGFLRRWATGLERRAAVARRLALVASSTYAFFFFVQTRCLKPL